MIVVSGCFHALKTEERARSTVRVVSSPCEALKFGADRVWSQQDGLRLV
jgi:hypothetical protein